MGFGKSHSSLSSSYGYFAGHLKRRKWGKFAQGWVATQMGLNFCLFYPTFLLTSPYLKWSGVCQPKTTSNQLSEICVGFVRPRQKYLIIWHGPLLKRGDITWKWILEEHVNCKSNMETLLDSFNVIIGIILWKLWLFHFHSSMSSLVSLVLILSSIFNRLTYWMVSSW